MAAWSGIEMCIRDSLVKLIQFLRDRLKTVTLVGIAVLVLLALADIFLVSNDEAHTAAEHFPAFWSIFGFAACVVICLLYTSRCV